MTADMCQREKMADAYGELVTYGRGVGTAAERFRLRRTQHDEHE
jgi:hypothetical protein